MTLSLTPSHPHTLPGMLELVTEASTLRAIQTEHGVTGSFKDRPLYDWLKRYNRTDSAYKQVPLHHYELILNGACFSCIARSSTEL